MKFRRILFASALLSFVLLVLPSEQAFAWGPGYGKPSEFRGWVATAAATTPNGSSCVISGTAGVREFGKHHVTRLKIKFELRGPNDSTSFLPTYRTIGYYYSASFPDDSTSYYVFSSIPTGALRIPADSSYSVWAVVVGERGWRRDFKARVLLGVVGCTIDEDNGFTINNFTG